MVNKDWSIGSRVHKAHPGNGTSCYFISDVKGIGRVSSHNASIKQTNPDTKNATKKKRMNKLSQTVLFFD